VVARAPGRLDVMGGIADYSGSLVLQLPLVEACHVAAQLRATPPGALPWPCDAGVTDGDHASTCFGVVSPRPSFWTVHGGGDSAAKASKQINACP
jgi:hypothetical protein